MNHAPLPFIGQVIQFEERDNFSLDMMRYEFHIDTFIFRNQTDMAVGRLR